MFEHIITFDIEVRATRLAEREIAQQSTCTGGKALVVSSLSYQLEQPNPLERYGFKGSGGACQNSYLC